MTSDTSITFAASETLHGEASYISGTDILVDGGLTHQYQGHSVRRRMMGEDAE